MGFGETNAVDAAGEFECALGYREILDGQVLAGDYDKTLDESCDDLGWLGGFDVCYAA